MDKIMRAILVVLGLCTAPRASIGLTRAFMGFCLDATPGTPGGVTASCLG